MSDLGSGNLAITTGAYFTCALSADRQVKCWGANFYGQLGDGTKTQRTTPVSVIGLGGGVKVISAAGFHVYIRNVDDGVQCWGQNNEYQNGQTKDSHDDGVGHSAGADRACIERRSMLITLAACGGERRARLKLQGMQAGRDCQHGD